MCPGDVDNARVGPFTRSFGLVDFTRLFTHQTYMPTRSRKRPRPHQTTLPPQGRVSEFLIVHQALEGWIHRQHVITREVVLKESAKLKAEIASLRKELRGARRKHIAGI